MALEAIVPADLPLAEYGLADASISELHGGAINRVFRVHSARGDFLLGSYLIRVRYEIITYPVRATREYLLPVTVSSGSLGNVDFGVRQADQMSFSGLAAVYGDFVSRPRVRAFIDGVDCMPGSRLVQPPDTPAAWYTVIVLSAEVRPGCGAEGKTIEFSIEGQVANEKMVWNARLGTGTTNHRLDLTVGPPFAYYVFQAPGFDGTELHLADQISG